MILFPCGKINLGLAIHSRRPDGYHTIESVFYPLPFYDVLEITPLEDEGFGFEQSGLEISGAPSNNLVVKAAMAFEEATQLSGALLHLHKTLPHGAGLGGGSSDAAFTLMGLNACFGNPLSPEQLRLIAAQLGSDCAFFLLKQAAYLLGTGPEITPFEFSLKGWHIAVVHPGFGVSTQDAYAGCIPAAPQYDLKSVVLQGPEHWKGQLANDFEQSVFKLHPQLAAIKATLYEAGAVYASMSGSGSAVFGIFKEATVLDHLFPGMYCKVGELA